MEAGLSLIGHHWSVFSFRRIFWNAQGSSRIFPKRGSQFYLCIFKITGRHFRNVYRFSYAYRRKQNLQGIGNGRREKESDSGKCDYQCGSWRQRSSIG